VPGNPELLPYTRYVMKMRFGPRWTQRRLDSSVEYNSELRSAIEKLPGKYHIRGFRDEMNMYEPHNSRQRKRLENYLAELHELYAKLIVVPVFYSTNYSIFWDESSCYTPNEQHPDWTGYVLYPDSGESQREQLVRILLVFLGKAGSKRY
ncbi:MAG TPA: hypothetical protein VI112_13600, partial [Bacteroidia bacterium]